MAKIKIFNEGVCAFHEGGELEWLINEFIADKKVIDIKLDTNYSRVDDYTVTGTMTVMVIYEEEEEC